jgi:hypothetical protein
MERALNILTDLRPFTRDADKFLTQIDLLDPYRRRTQWLVLGQSSLHKGIGGAQDIWALRAYLLDATDEVEDSAFALRLPLTGVRLEQVHYHYTVLVGWVSCEDPEELFNVPGPGTNLLAEAVTCTECEEQHPIVPSYMPPFDREVFETVAGKRVEITIGPAPTNDADSEPQSSEEQKP